MTEIQKRRICIKCARPLQTCFCHCITPVDNLWPVWIIQHHAEKKHAIGTAKIAALSLNHVWCLGEEGLSKNQNIQKKIQEASPVLVYPGENGMTTEQLKTETSRPLLFLDGSWRKTRKMLHEHPFLSKLPRLVINPDQESRYRIRKEPNESAISTLEAIVHVLSTLENDTNKYQSLLDTMDWMINKQIEYMGEAVYLRNYGTSE